MHVHLVAICGVGMAPLAVLLKKAGHKVTGSDKAAYPPMCDVLAEAGIEIMQGFSPDHIAERPELVIIGNAVPRTNPEAQAVEAAGIDFMSFPQAVAEYFIGDRKSLVVAGTHGKTTTTGMLSHALDRAGEQPGYLIGGLVPDLGEFAKAAVGDYFAIEGDEYDSAYFDKRPKFVHYRPFASILTSVEFDHADIYDDIGAIHDAFSTLAGNIPQDGLLVACGDYDDIVNVVVPKAGSRVVTYGLGEGNDWRVANLEESAVGVSFDAVYRGSTEQRISLSLSGEMNALNALAVYVLCRELGVDLEGALAGIAGYNGAARRQQKVGEEKGVVVIDDFAHHPTAVGLTLDAIRARYAGHRIFAVFEPRSNTSRRAVFQEQYTEALKHADAVALSAVFAKENDPLAADQMLSTEKIVADLAASGIPAWTADGPDAILERLPGELRSGDVVVCMSNGAFGGLPKRVLAALASLGSLDADLPVQP